MEESLFKIKIIENLDDVVKKRLNDHDYYNSPGMSYSQDGRKEEIDEFINRVELRDLMTDLGKSSEEVEHKLIYGKRYSLHIPRSGIKCDSVMNTDIEAKLMMREMCLFASSI